MVAYEKSVLVEDGGEIRLTGLPVKPGQRVRVSVTVEDDSRPERVAALRRLFADMQQSPNARAITDEQIAAEIDAYREGQ